jgi:hypothetical protein
MKKNIALAIILGCNALFIAKYTARLTDYAPIIAITITIIYYLLYLFISKMNLHEKWKILFIVGLVGYIAVSLVLFKKISIEKLNVDRWSVIYSFWDTYFSGKYPYNAVSHMDNKPGPMPFYFMLALPFYKLREIGFLPLFGVIAFIGLLYEGAKSSKLSFFSMLFVLSAPILWYEIASRSTIFVNGLLILVHILWVLRSDLRQLNTLLVISITGGLLIATRNVFLLPYLLVLIFLWNENRLGWREVIIGGSVTGITFVATFLPFVLPFGMDAFLEMNPFKIQSNVLIPAPYIPIFVLCTVLISNKLHKASDVIFYSGIILFATITFYFGYQINKWGFETAYSGSKTDIAYFIFCLPFLLYSIADNINSTK